MVQAVATVTMSTLELTVSVSGVERLPGLPVRSRSDLDPAPSMLRRSPSARAGARGAAGANDR